MTITPEQQKILDEAKQIAKEANLDLGDWNGDFEKRYKDTQASFTKAQNDKIEMAKMLVEADPANIEKITDEKIKGKILEEKWGVENIEQLKTLFPSALNPNKEEDEDELTEVEKLRQEVKLMKYQNTKTKTKEVLEWVISNNKDIVATIPEFEDKLREELKYISDKLSPKDRVAKAFKIVAW